jgi:hypothetical protein
MSRIPVNSRGAATLVVLVFLASACLGLSACGSSSSGGSTSSTANAAVTGTTTASTPATTAPTTTTEGRAREIALIRTLVVCMRQGGIKLPEPDASGQVNTHGINTNGAHYQAVLKRCLHKAKGH